MLKEEMMKCGWFEAMNFEKKIRTLKIFSKCVKFGTRSTHFEKKIQSKLNFGPT